MYKYLRFNNRMLTRQNGRKYLTPFDPMNPLHLPPNTIRVKWKAGYEPTDIADVSSGTKTRTLADVVTLVDANENIYDLYKESNNWSNLCQAGYVVEVLGANTSRVTNMSNMFYGCGMMTGIVLFDTSNVTNMSSLFTSYKLAELPHFNTSKVTNMSSMFSGSTFTDSPELDTSSVTNMDKMFYGCGNLVNVYQYDTSSVTVMSEMFHNCTSLETIPLLDTSSVTNMVAMFSECSSLETIPLIDTSSNTTMYNMFYECGSLISVPLLNTGNVTDMRYSFHGCGSLQSIPLFNTAKVDNMERTFYYCRKVQSGAYDLYVQASTQTTPVQYHSNTFYNCGDETTTGLADLNRIPRSWGGNS